VPGTIVELPIAWNDGVGRARIAGNGTVTLYAMVPGREVSLEALTFQSAIFYQGGTAAPPEPPFEGTLIEAPFVIAGCVTAPLAGLGSFPIPLVRYTRIQGAVLVYGTGAQPPEQSTYQILSGPSAGVTGQVGISRWVPPGGGDGLKIGSFTPSLPSGTGTVRICVVARTADLG
jgi:hypothetical protein